MAKNIGLRNAIKNAEEKYCEASSTLQLISLYVVFQGFNEETPEISIASGDEIIAVYKGREINKIEIIYYMESYDCITPKEFGFYD